MASAEDLSFEELLKRAGELEDTIREAFNDADSDGRCDMCSCYFFTAKRAADIRTFLPSPSSPSHLSPLSGFLDRAEVLEFMKATPVGAGVSVDTLEQWVSVNFKAFDSSGDGRLDYDGMYFVATPRPLNVSRSRQATLVSLLGRLVSSELVWYGSPKWQIQSGRSVAFSSLATVVDSSSPRSSRAFFPSSGPLVLSPSTCVTAFSLCMFTQIQ